MTEVEVCSILIGQPGAVSQVLLYDGRYAEIVMQLSPWTDSPKDMLAERIWRKFIPLTGTTK